MWEPAKVNPPVPSCCHEWPHEFPRLGDSVLACPFQLLALSQLRLPVVVIFIIYALAIQYRRRAVHRKARELPGTGGYITGFLVANPPVQFAFEVNIA